MRKMTWASWAAAATVGILLAGSTTVARADVTSDQAAAIVVWPIVNVNIHQQSLTPFAQDTLVQLSNTSNAPVEAHCFYLNANSHCSNSGNICNIGAECCGTGGCGFCLPGWNETDFRVILTARQPIAWKASAGLAGFCTPTQTSGTPCIPLDGVARRGPIDPADPTGRRSQSNAGTRIPPVAEDPFIGELKCVVIDRDTGEPLLGSGANVLKGEATLEVANDNRLDVGKYNAIGIRALDEPNDDGQPNVLSLLNSPETDEIGEYEGCPNVLILNHFFDFATNPALTSRQIFTWPVFVPCTENLRQQIPGAAVAQYLVFNEFEQRFSTSNTVQCFRATGLSRIDTTQPANSIFNVGIAGTLTGQTRVTPVGSGLLAVALEFHVALPGGTSANTAGAVALASGQQAATNVHYQGRRRVADPIVLP
jgi:hypothetical protein